MTQKATDHSKPAEANIGLSRRLISACSKGDANLVRQLLEKGANPNGRAKSRAGICPLVAAVGGGSLMVVRMLLKAGADPNSASFGVGDLNGSALEAACRKGRVDIAKQLVNHGADIDREGYWPPLKSAISYGQLESVKFLLHLGAKFKSGWLTQGTRHKDSVKIMQELVKSGADVNHHEHDDAADVTLRGRVPLHNVAERGLKAETEFLLRAGADPNRQLHYSKDTPLILAAQSGSLEVVRMLLEAGADITLTGWRGETAQKRARLFKRKDVAEYLHQYGGKHIRTSLAIERASKKSRSGSHSRKWELLHIAKPAKIVVPRTKISDREIPSGASDFVGLVHEWGHPEWVVLAVEAPLVDVVTQYGSCFPVTECRRSVPIEPSRRNDKGMAEWIPFVETVNSNWTSILRVVCLPIETQDVIQAIKNAELLSKKLRTRALSFLGEDTAGAMQCDLFENGKSVGTESWKHQGSDADGLFKKFGLYIPACYSQERRGSVWLAVWPSSQNKIGSAALVLPKA